MNNHSLRLVCLSTLAMLLLVPPSLAEKRTLKPVKAVLEDSANEIVIESVLASVDGIPITLREFSDKLVPKRKVTVADFARDPSLGQALDAMIMERMIEAEAANRKIKVNPEDLERYTNQVAAQNNLNKADFEKALAEQGKSTADFQHQARLEILRSRLMGQIAQSGPAVTDAELVDTDSEADEEEVSEIDQKIRYKLREIVLLKQQDDEEQAQRKASQVSERLAAGEEFSVIASSMSQGLTADNGGELGEVAEDDLSEAVKDAVAELSAGEFSEAIDMPDAIRFFYLEKKFDQGEQSDSGNENKEHLRKELENRKLEVRFQEFFTVELPKLHKVDRKV